MSKVRPLRTLGVGFAVGGAVAGIFALLKARRLRERALITQTALQGRGDDMTAYLASQGDDLAAELERMAQTKTTNLARGTAELLITNEYNLGPLTQERLARLDTAYRILHQAGYL